MILLIGTLDDPHLQTIQIELTDLGHRAIILDTSKEGLLTTQFAYSSHNNQFTIMQSHQTFYLHEITAAFCLSPLYARAGFNHTQTQDFWHFTWRETLHGVYDYLSKNTFFINQKIPNAISSQNKIAFFQAAAQAGFYTPHSLISNQKIAIDAFFHTHKNVVIKTMHQIYLEYQGEQTMMLVQEVSSEQFAHFSSDGECPVFLQEKIEKIFDIRAIVIGEIVLACKIDASQSLHGQLDWRAYDLPNTVHSIFKLPKTIEQRILATARAFHLDYACMDLCVDTDNQYWLLDVNPFGKYKWIEAAIGLPISRSIAKLLINNIG